MTVTWKYGTTYLHSLTMTARALYRAFQKNIDTGMGLERLAVVVQDVDSIFDIDTMKAIRDKSCEMSGKKYERCHGRCIHPSDYRSYPFCTFMIRWYYANQ